MQLRQRINLVSVAVLISTTVMIDLALPAVSLPTQGTLIARSPRSPRSRLRFRVGVRPSNRRVGGFSRAAICGNQQVLTSLVPPPQSHETLPDNQSAVDKTSLERPTFFVNVPALPPTTGQFTLQNEAGTKQLYSVKFRLAGKPGIVGITLPSSVPALQVGQKYFWQVRVACDPEDTTSNIIVSNWVERLNAPAGTGNDRLAALADQGIWQDTVTVLALQRYQSPQDPAIADDWASLMQDAGLPQFKQTAIVQMVKN